MCEQNISLHKEVRKMKTKKKKIKESKKYNKN